MVAVELLVTVPGDHVGGEGLAVAHVLIVVMVVVIGSVVVVIIVVIIIVIIIVIIVVVSPVVPSLPGRVQGCVAVQHCLQ